MAVGFTDFIATIQRPRTSDTTPPSGLHGEVAGANEMEDILSQMPREYRSLLPRPVQVA